MDVSRCRPKIDLQLTVRPLPVFSHDGILASGYLNPVHTNDLEQVSHIDGEAKDRTNLGVDHKPESIGDVTLKSRHCVLKQTLKVTLPTFKNA